MPNPLHLLLSSCCTQSSPLVTLSPSCCSSSQRQSPPCTWERRRLPWFSQEGTGARAATCPARGAQVSPGQQVSLQAVAWRMEVRTDYRYAPCPPLPAAVCLLSPDLAVVLYLTSPEGSGSR